MGQIRNGARAFLKVSEAACRYRRMPGFVTGLNAILGEADASQVRQAFDLYCELIENLIAVDNWFNQKDHTDDDADGEDAPPLG